MEKEKMTPQEWEINVKEGLAESSGKELLDLALHNAIQLAAALSEAKVNVRDEEVTDEDIHYLIGSKLGRMAVMLDVLQLKYGDCADHELVFLAQIAECLIEE